MRKLLTVIMLLLAISPAMADGDDDAPRQVRFKPWQMIWQCNDVRVTVTQSEPLVWIYDISGSLWFGSRFVQTGDGLYFNNMPCALLYPPPRAY
jgi:hypothetical protein